MKKKKKLPSDLKLLQSIYNLYFDEFVRYEKDESIRSSKIYVPIDVEKVGEVNNCDPELIFGRLYYHLDNKFGYKQESGSNVHFFGLSVGGDKHCVNFPFLASVLANLREDNRKFQIATWISVTALVISIISITISVIDM